VREILGDPVWKRSHLPTEIAPAALSASTRVLLSILETWPLPAAFTAPNETGVANWSIRSSPASIPSKKRFCSAAFPAVAIQRIDPNRAGIVGVTAVLSNTPPTPPNGSPQPLHSHQPNTALTVFKEPRTARPCTT